MLKLSRRLARLDLWTTIFGGIVALTAVCALWYAHAQIEESHHESQIQHLLALVSEFDKDPMATYRRELGKKRLAGTPDDPFEIYRELDFFETVNVLIDDGYLNEQDVWNQFRWWVFNLNADNAVQAGIQYEQKRDQNEYAGFVSLVNRLRAIDRTKRGKDTNPTQQDVKEFFLEESELVSANQAVSQQGSKPGQTEQAAPNSQTAANNKVNAAPTATVSNATSVDEPASQTNEPDGTSKRPEHNIDSFSTVVIAAFTVLSVVVLWLQGRATKVTERAWVVPDIDSPRPIKSADAVQVICRIRNTGKTPAWITAMGSCGQFVKGGGDPPRAPNYTAAGPFSSQGSLLSPNAFTETGITITGEQIHHLRLGETTLYFLGFVQYRDAFDEKHRTQYCYQLKANQDLTSSVGLEFYVSGAEHNSAN